MRTVLAGVLLSMLAAAGCSSSNAESQAVVGYDFGKIDKIAIVEVTGRVYGEAVKNQISNMFAMKLMEKGYKLIERKDIKTLLKEQQFQASDLASKEGAAKAGRILNVPAVMVIDIPKYSGGKMDMSAKLIDVEDATILWMGTGHGDTGKGLSTVVGAVAGVAAGAAIGSVASGGHSSTSTVLGGVGGGVIGGIAGNALAPEQETVLNRVIVKVIEKLPSRLPQPMK
jgi:phosphopantetheinyl transferase (holo-ACP synthase)